MGSSPLVFTGVTSFSADFQTILSRSVSIASLPLKRLQNEQADLAQKKALLAGLNGAVADVGSSLASLAAVAKNKALSATSSNPAKVSVVNSGATSAGTYAISNITSIAAAASETSISGYASSSTTPVSSAGSLNLLVGTQTFPILLAAGKNNLAGLRDAINSLGVGVTASVITTGTGANPNFLALSSNATGATTLALNDIPSSGPPVNLVTAANQGTNAVFQLNGLAVSRTSNTVNDVVPGLTFNILDKTTGTETVNLALNSDRSRLVSALQSFADKYNTLVDAVGSQIGPAGGLLTGDFLIRQIESDLRQVTTASQASGSVKSLADLGLSLDTKGKITLDSGVVTKFSDTQVGDAFNFLGTSTTGFGGLASKFTQLSDPAGGLIGLQQADYTTRNQAIAHQVDALNDRIASIQTSVARRLQLADTLIAQLQSQQQVLTASIQAVNLISFGKNNGNSNGS